MSKTFLDDEELLKLRIEELISALCIDKGQRESALRLLDLLYWQAGALKESSPMMRRLEIKKRVK